MKERSLAQEQNVLTPVGARTRTPDRSIRPKTMAVAIRHPRKSKSASFSPVSGYGLPQLYAVVEAGYVQIDVGQEHVKCLSLLAELSQQFTNPPAVKKQAAEAGAESSGHAREVPEQVVLYQSFDDIRAGCFRYVTASGNGISGKMIWLWLGIEQFEEFMAFTCSVFPPSRKYCNRPVSIS